ncbi:hypothetical protein CTEN210_17674 [Chaetoceros tenuissimus]|uniref:SET domain-containing protein n=1 Tax=Chaetoceros tenuissimus TaxID=426638 RepID=A0AAD3DB69_9STRA|nr:hypothetical protein CTEN210_17674 [Chaetoceros tenuissimus]
MDNQECEDNHDEASISSAEEGLMDLLGGLSSQMMMGATEEEIVMDEDKTSAQPEKKQTPIQGARLYQDEKEESNNACRKDMFSRAFHLTKDGQLKSPPVRIVDLSTEGKGNILVSSRHICKGEVIFSERSLEAAQVPSHAYDPQISANMSNLNGIRACQHCFKSMEPASRFKCEEENMELPMKHLWPIEEWEVEATSIKHESYDHILIDTHTGRMKCIECQALFCNKYCMQAHFQTMGSCCNCTKSMEAFINAMYQDREGEREDISIEPVLLLATRMFCAMVNSERNSKGSSGQLYQGFCGEASDCQPLRLGREKDGKFSLVSGYEEITKILQMNEAECRIHHLQEFEKVVAISQRNAISVTTASLFKTYYSAILRNCGRGTERQKEAMSQVAKLLGNPEGNLTRDMDRKVEEKVAVKIGGLFSLTAMMNHCCDPCAEIRSQEYVDCNIDVVAKRDIEAGEEITISYINLGSSPSNSIVARNRRRRDLESKYLFCCMCSKCETT